MAIFNGYATKAAAKRAILEAGHIVNAGLSRPESNPKVMKNQLKGVLAAPLHLSPSKLSGYNVCAKASAGCILACLHSAGNPIYKAAKYKARLAKTKAYFESRGAFMALICHEAESLVVKAKKLGMQPAIRLNATSDIPFERVAVVVNGVTFKNVMLAFPHIEWYDYTKIEKRAIAWASGTNWPVNYHLTFSKAEDNDSAVDNVLKAGGNVAAVFAKRLPAIWKGIEVINGDEHDFRPVDKKGCVVGLKAKGDAKKDTSGFVIQHIEGATA